MRVTASVYSRPVLDKYFMLLTCPSINKVLLTYLLMFKKVTSPTPATVAGVEDWRVFFNSRYLLFDRPIRVYAFEASSQQFIHSFVCPISNQLGNSKANRPIDTR
jgi:hypothetical protein